MSKVLKSEVQTDEITAEISRFFDYEFSGKTEFEVPQISPIDRQLMEDFSIGVIVGPSGTGKSSMLAEFGQEEELVWDPNKAVCSHFESSEDAQERLSAVGFNTVPSWMKPHHVLSNGEQFRANLARRLKSNAVVDEYTSVIDRNVAKSCSVATRRYVDKTGLKNVVFATCHYDIIEWLEPDWVFDTATGVVTTRGSLRRPEVKLEILPCTTKAWDYFRHHHYLTGDINKGARCWVAVWDGNLVGFSANISYPSGTVKNAWRGHRTVILPDFQGMGFGTRMSEAVAEMFIQQGKRYYVKTAHPRLGEYRNASPKWKPTSHHMKNRSKGYARQMTKENKTKREESLRSEELLARHKDRLCFAHEYVGG
jgi:GNAT superfamily N-acetyltransferase